MTSKLLLAGALFLGACDGAAVVERVVIVNDTDYPADTDVRGETGAWLQLVTVPPHEERAVEEVIDQGESWTFRFAYGGHDPVEVEISRAELADDDWRMEVPDALMESLREEGVPPPP